MATLTSGDTLSLNSLAGATGNTQNSNVSLGTIKGLPVSGDNIGLSTFAIDSVGTVGGYTYVVESTSEDYTLSFNGAGSNFNKISSTASNFSWSVPAGSYITLSSNGGATSTFSVSSMNPEAPSAQQTLLGIQTHTLRVNFADGYNDHIGSGNGYGVNKDKTVYSVDSYDGNSLDLCLLSDSPVVLSDGTIIEVGDLQEGDVLKGYSLNGLGEDDEQYFLDWSTSDLVATPKNVTVVNVIYSFASKYYSLNNGEVNATAEHPLLVKDSNDGVYRFKIISTIVPGDKLIKGDGTQVDVISNDIVDETVEIVALDVEKDDTFLVNGYITHNKDEGNAHTDLAAPGQVALPTISNRIISWSAPSSSGTTGITAYQVQLDNNSDFSSPTVDYDEYSTTSISINGQSLAAGTNYARVRAIDHGLYGDWSPTLTFTN